MRKQYFGYLIVGVAAQLAFSPSAFAAKTATQSGWFFGISLKRIQPTLELPGISFADNENDGYKFSAAYRFGTYWKAEFNYLDISEPSLRSNPVSLPALPQAQGKGLQIMGTANLPITEKIGLFGKFGASHSNLEGGCLADVSLCSAADRGTDINYGVGVRYDFTKTVSVRGEWDRFRRLSNRDTGNDPDRDVFSIGVGFKF